MNVYDENSDNNEWFQTVKTVGEKHGYTGNMKEYKQNPQNYKGSVADISMLIRLAITGRDNSPDLCDIMHVLGKETVNLRINAHINYYSGDNNAKQ
jgi:glutamyl-tRNA synthetase